MYTDRTPWRIYFWGRGQIKAFTGVSCSDKTDWLLGPDTQACPKKILVTTLFCSDIDAKILQ